MSGAIKRIKAREAPGPDGVPGKVLALASGYLSERLRRLFTGCLK